MGKKRQGGGKVQDGLETRQKLFKPTDSESQGCVCNRVAS